MFITQMKTLNPNTIDRISEFPKATRGNGLVQAILLVCPSNLRFLFSFGI